MANIHFEALSKIFIEYPIKVGQIMINLRKIGDSDKVFIL